MRNALVALLGLAMTMVILMAGHAVVADGPDSDSDGFDDMIEIYLGTNFLSDCPVSDDAWPLDMNMDRFLTTVGDVGRVAKATGGRWWLGHGIGKFTAPGT